MDYDEIVEPAPPSWLRPNGGTTSRRDVVEATRRESLVRTAKNTAKNGRRASQFDPTLTKPIGYEPPSVPVPRKAGKRPLVNGLDLVTLHDEIYFEDKVDKLQLKAQDGMVGTTPGRAAEGDQTDRTTGSTPRKEKNDRLLSTPQGRKLGLSTQNGAVVSLKSTPQDSNRSTVSTHMPRGPTTLVYGVSEKDDYRGSFRDDKRDGTGTCQYANGDHYDGQWKENKKVGTGIMKFNNGDVYEGQWVNDMMHGRGRYAYRAGDLFEGQFIENKRQDGQGIMEYANGDVYKGNFLKKMRSGNGECMYANGDKYNGEWKHDRKHGEGTFFMDDKQATYQGTFDQNKMEGHGILVWNNNQYTGHFKDGIQHGNGTCLYSDGSTYEGHWERGKHDGMGKLVASTGDVYEGRWFQGVRHGRGKQVFKNGNVYEGQWRHDRNHNTFGKMTYTNNSRYDGYWVDGMRSGQGTLLMENGNKYVGAFILDKKTGYGIMEYPDNTRYDGQWALDKPEGKGFRSFPSGEWYEGEWVAGLRNGQGSGVFANKERYDGKWSSDKPNGRGVHYYINGDVYEGEWRDGRRNGKGICVYANGERYDGTWRDDKREGPDAKCTYYKEVPGPDGNAYYALHDPTTAEIERNRAKAAVAAARPPLTAPVLPITDEKKALSLLRKKSQRIEAPKSARTRRVKADPTLAVNKPNPFLAERRKVAGLNADGTVPRGRKILVDSRNPNGVPVEESFNGSMNSRPPMVTGAATFRSHR